jgi:protein TonB
MIRWLPLSLAVHVAALGGGVWLARQSDEPALLVDLSLMERAVDSSEAVASAPGTRAPRSGGRPAQPSARATSSARAGSAPAAISRAPASPATPREASTPPTASAAATSSAAPAVPSAPAPATPMLAEAAPAPGAIEPAASTPSTSPIARSEPGHADVARASESSAAAGDASGSSGSGLRSGGADGGGSMAGASSANGGAGGDGPLALAIPGDGGAGAYGAYLTALRRRLHELLEYPAVARRRGLTGTVHLEIALEPTGRVSEVVVVRSSDHDVLDHAALQAARSLRRVPFPSDVRPRALRVRLPVVFELR